MAIVLMTTYLSLVQCSKQEVDEPAPPEEEPCATWRETFTETFRNRENYVLWGMGAACG